MSPRRLALAVLACLAAATAPAAASDGPLVDLALTAGASAPAVNDGNAATTACASGPVTLDLGRPAPARGLRGQPRGRRRLGARDDRGGRPAHRGDGARRHARVAAGPPPARRAHRAPVDQRGRVRRRAARARAHLAIDDRRPRPLLRRPGGGRPAPPTPTAAAPRCPSASSPTTAPTGCACACGSTRPPATATCRASSRWRAARRPPACASCSTRTTRTSGPIRRSSRSRPSWPARTCRRWPTTVHDYTRDALERADRAGHAGADAPARQRDPQRHPVADRAARRQRRPAGTGSGRCCAPPPPARATRKRRPRRGSSSTTTRAATTRAAAGSSTTSSPSTSRST